MGMKEKTVGKNGWKKRGSIFPLIRKFFFEKNGIRGPRASEGLASARD
jgi:hypothetical protein